MTKTLRNSLVVIALLLSTTALLPRSDSSHISVTGFIPAYNECNATYALGPAGLVNDKNYYIKSGTPCIISWTGSNWDFRYGASTLISTNSADCGLDPPNGGWSIISAGRPTLVGGCFLVPVELTLFEATADGHDVLLHWETASETNNAGFEIQSKPARTDSPNDDEDTWHVWDYVLGHGTTLEPQTYQHRLDDFAPGAYRFRLKQLDFDGTFEYSPEVELAIALPEAFLFTAAYPNPFNPQTQLSLMVKRAQHVTVSVYDLLGRQVAVLFAGEMGSEQARSLVFEAGGLPSGTYVIQAVGETFTASQRVVLAK